MLEITAALAAMKSAVDIAKAGIDARDDAKVKEAIADMSGALLDAYSVGLALADRCRVLQQDLQAAQQKCHQLEAAAEEKAAYAITAIRPGAFAYAPKDAASRGEAGHHYLCQPCYDKSIKSMLRYSPGNEYTNGEWTCPESAKHTIENRPKG